MFLRNTGHCKSTRCYNPEDQHRQKKETFSFVSIQTEYLNQNKLQLIYLGSIIDRFIECAVFSAIM
jgi:methyl coenzyme M reductase subunit C